MTETRPAYTPDGSAASAGNMAGLPSWDLGDLYASPESPAIEADLAGATGEAQAFAAEYAGKLARLPGADLARAMERFEAIDEVLGRVMSYAQLLFSADSTDAAAGQFYQRMMERVTDVSALTLFFRLELNRIEDGVLEAKFDDAGFARWRPYLRDLRVYRPHQLSDELERFIHEREVTGRAAWSRLFDETVAGMRVRIGEDALTVSAALNKLSDHDRMVRETAAHAVGAAFGEREKLFSLITNTLAKDKEIVDSWRHYPRPASERNLSNVVEDEVVDALVSAVVAEAPCQCFSPGANQTTSPGRISSTGPPSRCAQPSPAVTTRVCPNTWVCQAVRAPGSKVTYAPSTRPGSSALKGASMRTVPVKYCSGALTEGLEPLFWIFMGFLPGMRT